jgi:hypothetical protein
MRTFLALVIGVSTGVAAAVTLAARERPNGADLIAPPASPAPQIGTAQEDSAQ